MNLSVVRAERSCSIVVMVLRPHLMLAVNACCAPLSDPVVQRFAQCFVITSALDRVVERSRLDDSFPQRRSSLDWM